MNNEHTNQQSKETFIQKQSELSELDESFDVEDELGKKAQEVTDARNRITAARKHYDQIESEMIGMLKDAGRKSYKYEGKTISITVKQADESISIRTL